MKIKAAKAVDAIVKIEVEVDDKNQTNFEKQGAKMLAEQVSIKGFRKGHIPKKMLIEKFGEDVFFDFVIEKFINNIYSEALKEAKIMPVAMPDFEVKSKNPIKIEFKVPVSPEIDLKKAKKIKLNLKTPKITKKEVKEAIDKELEIQTSYTKTDKAAKIKDRLIIDFEGFDKKGELIEGTKAQKQFLVLGSKKFIPGFEEALVGSKAEQDVEFEVTFPKDYHKEDLQNAKVTFKVHVHGVESPSAAKLDEETIQKIYGEKLSKEEFEEKTEVMLLNQKTNQAKKELEEELFEKLLEATEIKIADAIIDQNLSQNQKQLMQQLQQQNKTLEDYIAEFEKQTKKDFAKEQRDQAEKQAKMRFLLDALNKEYDLSVSEKDVEAKIKEEIDKAPAVIKEHVKNFYQKGSQGEFSLKNQIYIDKLFEIFVTTK